VQSLAYREKVPHITYYTLKLSQHRRIYAGRLRFLEQINSTGRIAPQRAL
jgi:hypothetical protein